MLGIETDISTIGTGDIWNTDVEQGFFMVTRKLVDKL